jgi:hypothetical protein
MGVYPMTALWIFILLAMMAIYWTAVGILEYRRNKEAARRKASIDAYMKRLRSIIESDRKAEIEADWSNVAESPGHEPVGQKSRPKGRQ